MLKNKIKKKKLNVAFFFTKLPKYRVINTFKNVIILATKEVLRDFGKRIEPS